MSARTLNRRRLLMEGAAAAATAAMLKGASRAEAAGTPTSWVWNNPFENGGRGNAVAFDPNIQNRVVLGGDTWCARQSLDRQTWQPCMKGIPHGGNDGYGRSVHASLSQPGVMYYGGGELKTTVSYFSSIDTSGNWTELCSADFSDNEIGRAHV